MNVYVSPPSTDNKSEKLKLRRRELVTAFVLTEMSDETTDVSSPVNVTNDTVHEIVEFTRGCVGKHETTECPAEGSPVEAAYTRYEREVVPEPTIAEIVNASSYISGVGAKNEKLEPPLLVLRMGDDGTPSNEML